MHKFKQKPRGPFKRRIITFQSFTFFLLPVFFFFLLFLFSLPKNAAGQTAAQIFPAELHFEGKNYRLQSPLLQIGGTTFAPFREIFSFLGADIGYTAKHGRLLVWADMGKDRFLLERGAVAFYHNDSLLALPELPFTVNGSLYFPLRFLLRQAGYGLHLEKTAPQGGGEKTEAHLYLFRLPSLNDPSPDPSNDPLNDPSQAQAHFRPAASRVPVLMYHHLVPAEENDGKNGAVVSVEAFAEQMEYLFAAGYRTVTLKDLYLFVTGQKKLPPKTVVLTFDDGYASNYEYAYPILKEHHFRAVQFPITGKVNFWVPRMTEEMMAESADVFEFHSHSHNLHYYLEGRPAMLLLDQETILEDLRRSKELLDCFAFSYPFGAYNEEIIRLLKKAGYKMAFTIRPGYVYPGDDPFTLKRLGVYPETNLEDFILLLENFN